MRSLAITIFLSFWLVFALLIASFAVLPDEGPSRRTLDHVREHGRIAVRLLERGGATWCHEFVAAVEDGARLRLVVLDDSGALVCGPEGVDTLMLRGGGGPEAEGALVEAPVTAPSGAAFTALGVALTGFHGLPDRPFPLQAVLTAIVVSGLVCFTLAGWLARPLRQVRDASQRLAAGDLQARAGPQVGTRRDEIGDLVRDFDTMAARLEALVDAQSQLLSDISHELRSPLARLNVALELARRKAGPGAETELTRIETEAERMNDLIGRLLALARAESAGGAARTPVALDAVVARIADDARFEAQRQDKGVTVHADEAIEFPGDARLVDSAIDNVVRNAVRHTAAGTAVDITLERTPDAVVVHVRDHGPGVPAEEVERIFTPFHRVDRGRARDSGGVGLGLAIARRALRVHGGTITAANAPGGGLVVTLRFPATVTPSPQVPDSSLREPDHS